MSVTVRNTSDSYHVLNLDAQVKLSFKDTGEEIDLDSDSVYFQVVKHY